MATERIRQQRTPTEFGPSATALSGPDLSGARFSTQGVRDNASAIMGHAIGQAAQTAGQAAGFGLEFANDFHTGLAMADLEKKHEENIQGFLDSQPGNKANLALDASSLNEASNSLWAKVGEGASISDIDTVEKHYQDQIGRLQRANKQGVMSADEFAMNTMAITRQAINKNPHLFDELTNHARKVLGMSGVDSFIKAQQDTQEAQQKIYQARVSQNMQILKENNIPTRYDPQGNYDLAYGEEQAAAVQKEKFAADVMSRNASIRTEQEKQQAAHFIKNFGVEGVNGMLNQTNEAIRTILEQPGNKTDQNYQIKQLYQRLSQSITQQAGPVMHLDGVKDILTYAQNSINAAQKTFESFNNKEDQTKFLSNARSILTDSDYIRNAKIASPAAIESITKIMTAAGPEFLRQNPTLWAKTQQSLINLVSGASNGLGTDYSLNGMNGKSVVMNGLDYLAGQDDSTSATSMNNIFKTIYADSQSLTGPLSDEATKFKFYDQFISSLATAGNSKSIRGKLDTEALSKVSQNFNEYMNMTLGNFSRDLSKVQGLQTSTLPDGRIQITGSNPQDTNSLMMKYVVRINNGITAYSNLMGLSQKQAGEALFQQYPQLSRFAPADTGEKKNNFGVRQDGTQKGNGFLGVLKRPDGGVSTELSVGVNLGGKEMDIPTLVPSLKKEEVDYLLGGGQPTKEIVDKAVAHAKQRLDQGKSVFAEPSESPKSTKPNESNPLNLTIPGKTGQFQSFNSVEEGLQAASNQLDRYFTGKTTGKPLTTVDQIAGLWNNENEKGSSSKADYVKTIVRFSGLDPNIPLDLTDPNVKADLMYGMAKAEGRNLRPSQILMAINK